MLEASFSKRTVGPRPVRPHYVEVQEDFPLKTRQSVPFVGSGGTKLSANIVTPI
jgi:hypothetical protein